MRFLYSERETERLENCRKRDLWLMLGVTFCALAACVMLCLKTHTGNTARSFVTVVLISTLCTWADAAWIVYRLRPMKARIRQCRYLLSMPAREIAGRILGYSEEIRVRGIAGTVRFRFLSEGEEQRLSVESRFLRQLPGKNQPVRLLCAGTHLIAFEEKYEDHSASV